MIILLCSVPQEAEFLRSSITGGETFDIGTKTIITGELSGQRVALCSGGMGKANAAHAAAILITRYAPQAFVIFGIGGAYPGSGAKVGEIALATEEIAGDEGVLTPGGFKDTSYINIPLVRTEAVALYNRFPAHDKLLAKALQSLPQSSSDTRMHKGPFVTLSTCTGALVRAKELEAMYHGLCENMEGAAAAQVAVLHGIPWLEVRGISNIVEDRDLGKWDIPKAAEAAQKAVIRILEGWGA